MATATLTLNEFQDYPATLQRRLSDINWTPLLRSMAKYLESKHAEYFRQQTGPDSQPWKQLAKSTIRRKGHPIILIEKDDLEQTLTQSNHADAIREIYDEGDRAGLGFGTRRPYAHFHQRGTVRLAQRMHVGANKEIVSELKTQVRDFAIGSIVGGNLL